MRLRKLSLPQKDKHCMVSSHVAPRLCLSHVNHVCTYDLKAEVSPSRGAREEMRGMARMEREGNMFNNIACMKMSYLTQYHVQ